MSFTPKFVDLVRNATSVQGTGPVSLGAVPAGFTGFAQACIAGDRFYYCIQGTDKPAEREVGRGTLQADGTIAREAISGELTRFSAGAKTISLVAAADWFQQMAQFASAPPASGGGGGGSEIASRDALAALPVPAAGTKREVTESGCEGLFSFDATDRQPQVAGDPARGLFVAPSSAPTGASGAWVRVVRRGVRPEWWGARADSNGYAAATDNLPAFNAMFAALGANPLFQWAGAQSSFQVELGHGTYYFSDKLLCRPAKTFVMAGRGAGWRSSAPSTKLLFAAGKKGLIFDRGDTLDDGLDPGDGRGNDGSHIRDLMVESMDNGTGTDGGFHGIQARCQIFARDVTIRGFRGHGLMIMAKGNAAPQPYRGNANSWMLTNVSASENKGNGVHVEGQDSNQGAMYGGDCTGNGGWGVWSNCFLGSSFRDVHASGNAGGAFYSFTNTSKFDFCYSEGNQPASDLNGATAYGGLHGAGFASGLYVYPDGGNLAVAGGGIEGRTISGGKTWSGIVGRGESDFVMAGYSGIAAPFTMRFYGLGGAGNEDSVGIGHGYGTPAMIVHGSTATIGPKGGVSVRKLAVGINWGGITLSGGGSPPASGEMRGTLWFTDFATEGDFLLERQVSGDPASPTWEKIYGAINKVGIGYAVYGGGGNVTQAASKSAGVALNKMAGLVTMDGGALAAGAAVRFTVSNDMVRPQDTVQLTLASGAADPASYGWWTVARAGAFDVVVRNFSAGALGEALAFNFTVIKGQWL